MLCGVDAHAMSKHSCTDVGRVGSGDACSAEEKVAAGTDVCWTCECMGVVDGSCVRDGTSPRRETGASCQ